MRKQKYLLPLLSSLTVFTLPGQTLAQETATTDDFESEDIIIVTGTPVRQQIFTAPADVDVLAGEALKEQRAAGLGQTLDQLPGVNLVSTGEQVGNPVIRGLSGNRIRILSNGVGLNYQQYGVRHPANLDPFIADRIEVVRGPATLQYGSDAIGGAINVLSRRPPSASQGEVSFNAEASAGFSTAHRSTEGAFSFDGASGPVGISGTIVARDARGLETPNVETAFESGDNSDPLVSGKLPYTDFTQLNGDLALGFQAADLDGIVRWETYASDQNYLVPDPGAPVTAGGLGQELRNNLFQAEVNYDTGRGIVVSPSIALSVNERRANRGGADPLPLPVTSETLDVDIERKTWTSRLIAAHDDIAGLSGQIGAEFVYEEQESTGPSRLTPGGTVQNYALFAFEAFKMNALTVNAGLRHDWRLQKADPERTTNITGLPTDPDILRREYSATTAGLGASYEFADNIVLAGNIRSAFRAPDLFELYANGLHNGVAAVQIGDADLKEEKAVTFDASLRTRFDNISATLTLYKTAFEDYITLAGTGNSAPNGLPIFTYIQEDATLTGGDLEIVWQPAAGWEVTGVYESVSGELDATGRDMPLMPADTLQMRVRRSVEKLGQFDRPYAEFALRHAADKKATSLIEPFYQFDQPGSAFGTASTEAYTLLDAVAGAEFRGVSIRLEATNLLDEDYRDFLDTYKAIALGPGRDISLSFTREF